MNAQHRCSDEDADAEDQEAESYASLTRLIRLSCATRDASVRDVEEMYFLEYIACVSFGVA